MGLRWGNGTEMLRTSMRRSTKRSSSLLPLDPFFFACDSLSFSSSAASAWFCAARSRRSFSSSCAGETVGFSASQGSQAEAWHHKAGSRIGVVNATRAHLAIILDHLVLRHRHQERAEELPHSLPDVVNRLDHPSEPLQARRQVRALVSRPPAVPPVVRVLGTLLIRLVLPRRAAVERSDGATVSRAPQ